MHGLLFTGCGLQASIWLCASDAGAARPTRPRCRAASLQGRGRRGPAADQRGYKRGQRGTRLQLAQRAVDSFLAGLVTGSPRHLGQGGPVEGQHGKAEYLVQERLVMASLHSGLLLRTQAPRFDPAACSLEKLLQGFTQFSIFFLTIRGGARRHGSSWLLRPSRWPQELWGLACSCKRCRLLQRCRQGLLLLK